MVLALVRISRFSERTCACLISTHSFASANDTARHSVGLVKRGRAFNRRMVGAPPGAGNEIWAGVRRAFLTFPSKSAGLFGVLRQRRSISVSKVSTDT